MATLNIDGHPRKIDLRDKYEWIEAVRRINSGEQFSELIGDNDYLRKLSQLIRAHTQENLRIFSDLSEKLHEPPDLIVVSAIQSLFGTGKLIWPDSEQANLVITHKNDLPVALSLLALVLGLPTFPLGSSPGVQGLDTGALRASVKAVLSQDGLLGRKERSEEMLARWADQASQMDQKTKAATAALEKIENTHKSLMERTEAVVLESRQSIKNHTESVNTSVTLDTAQKYWDDLAKKAHTAANRWLVAIASYVLIGAATAYWWFVPHLHATATAPWDKVPFWQPAAGALLIVCLIWGARLMSRQYTNNIHLYSSYRERKAFVETYLALLKDGHATEANRDIVLRAVFRPATEGLIGVDHGPLGPMEVLNKVVPGSGGGRAG